MGRPKKTVQIEVNRQFLNWCSTNGLMVKKNQEVFFVNERLLMKPEYIINDSVFVDIIPTGQFDGSQLINYQLFANSFGTLIIIKEEDAAHLNTISRRELEKRHNFSFNAQ